MLLIADCSYVTLYCKDPDMLEALFQQAVQCGFHRVDYVQMRMMRERDCLSGEGGAFFL
ncbi:DUF2691 family protein [Bacillus amyloliquefaciens]|nr:MULTISPECIES: DUF2691 family protein [Bacillus amyloliquefaciens group]MEC2215269.1 DUF2691 family protein [Bacillus velezensis]MED2998335.1 DUF2691 family protein [Bacillus velezensis]UUA78933.1 DUF2691 family protein [Bacillus amyloliquefaciens]